MRISTYAALFFVGLTLALPAMAEIQTKTIEYQDGDTVLEGYLALDPTVSVNRPGVLVIHEWWGLNDYARSRARQLAELGYVAFAADIYGKGKVTSHPEQAGEWSGEIMKNLEVGLRRARLGLEQLKAQPGVDTDRLAAIGYCFGGTAVTMMAYEGFPLRGVVSFHGSLPPAPEGRAITTKLLFAHGAADPFVPKERFDAFIDSLNKAKADWQIAVYGGTVHSFTNPGADAYGMQGVAYNAEADHRSWALMQAFFNEIFWQ